MGERLNMKNIQVRKYLVIGILILFVISSYQPNNNQLASEEKITSISSLETSTETSSDMHRLW